jgi:hypothetical protein
MPDGEQEPRIPDFHSREEKAAFWDSHEMTDYLDALRPVRVRFAPNPGSGMTVIPDADDLEALGRIAAERGIGPSTLVRMWIKERLKHEA